MARQPTKRNICKGSKCSSFPICICGKKVTAQGQRYCFECRCHFPGCHKKISFGAGRRLYCGSHGY